MAFLKEPLAATKSIRIRMKLNLKKLKIRILFVKHFYVGLINQLASRPQSSTVFGLFVNDCHDLNTPKLKNY